MIATMRVVWVLGLVLLFGGVILVGVGRTLPPRPAVVSIGAIFTLNSTVGRVAKIAIGMVIDDVNSNPSVIGGTKLKVNYQDSNCSAFFGIDEALQFMETDVVAVIGPQSSIIAHAISYVANELCVRLLSFAATDPTLSSLEYPYFVRTTQSDLFQMAAIAELVDYYHWRQVITIFIDDDYGRNGISALGDKLVEKCCKIAYKAAVPSGPGLSANDITDILVKVAMMESRIIVLHTNPDSGLEILSVANHLIMMGNGYVWIATDWLSLVLDSWAPVSSEIMQKIQGVLTLRMHTEDSNRKTNFISRWS